MATELTLEFIKTLPKTDLHTHLDGGLRLDTLIALARKDRIELPTEDREALFQLLYAGEECTSLEQYLQAFTITLSVMQSEENLERIAFEFAEDAWNEGVRYLEVRYAPVLHTRAGLSLTAIVEAVLRGLRMAEQTHGIRFGLLLCGIRSMDREFSVATAEMCIEFKNRGVVGFDLAGPEANHPPGRHQKAFQLLQSHNINCTVHAGEGDGAQSIAQAIHGCGARRIGHGTRLVEDPALLDYVNDHRIALEMCPSSNVQTKAAASWEAHPIDSFLDRGLLISINTDSRLMSNTTVSNELWQCHRHYGWSLQRIKDVLRAGFASAFMAYRDKMALLSEIDAELAAIQMPVAEPAPE